MTWEKFAISGATYARALRGAASRSGAQLPQGVLGAIESRPAAQLVPGLATRARGGVAGALQPTAQQRSLQQMATKIPETSEGIPGEFAGAGHATQRFMFNQMFGNRAQMTQSPSIPSLDAWKSLRNPAHVMPGTMAANPRALRKVGEILPTLAQIGIPLATAGGVLASKPGIRADVANLLGGGGNIQQKDTAAEIPQDVLGQAGHAAEALKQRGLDPTKLRFAVDAPVGAGKTTLSRALAQQMGLQHKSLDYRPHLRLHQMLGGGDVEKMPVAPSPGEILEHHQLLRSYDPESFDVALHILRNPETLRQQLIQRGRGARAAELMDLDKSIDVGRRAFESLGGDVVDLGGGVQMKIRPQEGWGGGLDEQLAQAGIDPAGLSRHEKLLSLSSGQRTQGAGWTPYVRSPLTPDDVERIRSSVPLGQAAARALSR